MSADLAAARPYTADVDRGRVFLMDAAGGVICELHWSRKLGERVATASLLAAGATMADLAADTLDALNRAAGEAERHGEAGSVYHTLIVRLAQRWQAASLKLATVPDVSQARGG